MLKKRVVFLVGPTGIGKSAVALSLAKKINAEIISCDSMQVYRAMDIVTSKVDAGQRKKVQHHLLNVIQPDQEYDVAKYRSQVLQVFDKLFLKEKIPLVVGGTGLYYSIIIDGLFAAVPEDKLIRKKLNQQLELKGSKYLYRKLIKVDLAASKRIHPNDSRRIIRALEVYLKTGKPISQLQKNRIGLGPEYEVKVFGLNTDRELLYKKIDQRVEQMFTLGLEKEVRLLLKRKLSKTAACAIGIKELKKYFQGKCSLEEAKRSMQQYSRNYAKRQLTWFKKDKRVQWINIYQKMTPSQIAQIIWKKLS
ncbi:MAG: tRNA (adenosine(37)-N6)-dimethylallyltransferase MiaA [Candidatus Omnitrophota bacterium]